jgi:hypothetical protein
MANPGRGAEREPASVGNIAPNIFYDIIVFLTPTITFLFALSIGLHDRITVLARDPAFSIDIATMILVGLALFFASYEFGRVAETYSDVFVARPIRWLHKRGWLFKNPDYNVDLSEQVRMTGVDGDLFFGRAKSKWTIFFFALEYIPHVGSDLLKRYAWEKLARSSAFAIFLIFMVSVLMYGYHLITGYEASPWAFGSIELTLVSLFLYLVWTFDYYQRNCWNCDLLITTMPVIVAAVHDLRGIQPGGAPQDSSKRPPAKTPDPVAGRAKEPSQSASRKES